MPEAVSSRRAKIWQRTCDHRRVGPGLQQGQFVDLTSHSKDETRIGKHFMVAPFDIPRGCTATYFPEANVLVSINNIAERSNTPVSRSVVITIAPSADPAAAVAELQRNVRRQLHRPRLEPASLSVSDEPGVAKLADAPDLALACVGGGGGDGPFFLARIPSSFGLANQFPNSGESRAERLLHFQARDQSPLT